MSDLTHLTVSTGYVDTPKADDFVHADLLKEAINDEIVGCINEIIDRMNLLTREDNTLKDQSIRLRMLAPEVSGFFLNPSYFVTARIATTATLANLSGIQTVDSVLLQDGDIVLVKDQDGAPSTNGLYVVSAGLWARYEPMVSGWAADGSVYVWVTGGDTNAYSAWVWLPQESPVIGTDPVSWTVFQQEYRPTLDPGTVDALAGTEGTPSDINRFVTDDDPRLDVFGDAQDGLVPSPGVVTTCIRFLCEDGTWATPGDVLLDGVMRVNQNNVMEAGGEITFGDTVGIHGLANPVLAGDAVNKGYADALFDLITPVISALTDFAAAVVAVNGILVGDGAGGFTPWDGTWVGDMTVDGKLTVTGLIDPTGMQFDPVAANPGNSATLWVDDGPGDLWFGAGNITGSIVAAAAAAAAAQGDATQALADAAAAQGDATQALADAAAAQATADAAQAVTDALDALDGILVGDGAGGYSAIAIPGGAVNFLREDGVFAPVPGVSPPSRGEISGVPANLAMTGPGTWDQILLPGAGGDLLTGMTQVGNGLQADLAMSGRAVAQISADLNAAQSVKYALAVNGTVVAKSVAEVRHTGVGTQFSTITVVGLLDLALNDVVTVVAEQQSGSATLTFSTCNLTFKE